MFFQSGFRSYYYFAIILLLQISKHIFFCLESNEYQSPQIISDEYNDLCAGRSNDCEVQLDVPVSCIDAEGSTSTCPIVFFLHGSGGTNDNYKHNSKIHENKMIGIYPNGDCNGWSTGPKNCHQCEWDDFDCTKDPNEGEFVAKIITRLRAMGASGNIYARGFSNGAALALRLAVNAGLELPITGIVATVTQLLASPERSGPGALNYNQPISSNSPVSVLSICGTADNLIPYEGGSSPVFGGWSEDFYFMSNKESNEAWAAHSGCDLNPEIQTVSSSLGTSTAEYFQYHNCLAGTYVEHYKVNGAGHNAGGARLNGKSSNDIAYDFIRKVEEADTGINPPSASPTTTSSPTVTSSPSSAPFVSKCEDDETWQGKFSTMHTCDFVADNTSVRCEWEDSDGIAASKACALSCNTCETTPECEDDQTWQGKSNAAHTCDFVADNPSVRCKWEDSDGIVASEACALSCDICETYPPSPSKKTKKIAKKKETKKTKKTEKVKKTKKTNGSKNATKGKNKG